jgi:hypothetical protein
LRPNADQDGRPEGGGKLSTSVTRAVFDTGTSLLAGTVANVKASPLSVIPDNLVTYFT